MDSEARKRLFEKHKVTPADLVNHTFLPKRLPQSEEPNLQTIELAILEYFNLTAGVIDYHDLSPIQLILDSWIQFESGETTPQYILSNLKDSETACFYVRKQNCTIQFTKLKHREHMRVITFRSSLPNELVTGTSGSLLVAYPETTHVVPISELLLSECFSNQVVRLWSHASPIAMPVTEKGGEFYLETREPSFPYVVSEYLVGMLCPGDLEEVGEVRSVKFEKKLRDQVNWDSCDVPFRRSGLWMSVKVVVQMRLNEELESKAARLIYKIAILKMLESLAIDFVEMDNPAWDVTAQSLVKLARRVKKLSGLGKCENAQFELLRNETVKQVLLTIENIHKKVSEQWLETVEAKNDELEVRKITRNRANWTNDCVHKIDLTYLRAKIKSPQSNPPDNLKNIDPVVQTTSTNLNSLLAVYDNLSSDKQDVHVNNTTVWIYHVEWFVRHGLSIAHDCGKIFSLLDLYTKTVFQLYGDVYSDPVCFSRMAVTVMKVVAVLDEIAVVNHQVLRSYNTGIQPGMFECLLAAGYREMVLVENLKEYFTTRNNNAVYPDWLGSSDVSRTSFPVVYAQSDPEMMRLKEKILRVSEVKIELKKAEIAKVREQCSEIQVRVNSIACTSTWSSYREMNVHDDDCVRCKLTTLLHNKRHSVSIYQRPLPPETPGTEYLRDAVVFELAIPRELAYLRDGLSILSEIFGYILLSTVQEKNIDKKWMEFGELVAYTHSGFQKLVHVGSEVKDVLTTHYGRVNPGVNSGDGSFIVENGMNCKVYKVDYLVDRDKPLEDPFTVQINRICEPVRSTYQSLQFALNVKRPTENKVIANQYKCDQNITVKEFVTFGSMRCGHNIQLRNLYAAIANQELPLHQEPVLALVVQTVWEVGPGKREVYVDFEREDIGLFCDEFLELLRKRSVETCTNWSSPVGLLSLVVITVKILEMSGCGRVKESAGRVLRDYRGIVEGWCCKLERLISKSSEGELLLMETLLKCCVCSAFTFNVSSELFNYVFSDPVDLKFWMNTLTRLHYLVVRENVLKKLSLSSFMKNLVRHARVTIPLSVQDHLHGLLGRDQWNKGLHEFVCSQWKEAQEISERDIPIFHHSGNVCPEKKHAYRANYIVNDVTHSVCVDILRGAFFVDGYPPSLLPESITRNPLFGTFFHNSKFRVQRNHQTFKTNEKYRGQHFKFTEVGDRLVIRQVCKDGYLELVPREVLKKHVPPDLIDEFTHWFDSKDKVVYFRRASYDEDLLDVGNETDYMLKPVDDSLVEWHLVKYQDNTSYFLSISSPGFKYVARTLGKLEHSEFIHVVFEDKQEISITAKLLRMNMSFSLNQGNGLLYCDKYQGYYVPVLDGQNLGTFVGLESGLVLEKCTDSEASGKKRVLLIQHGTIGITQKESAKHQTVRISGRLRNPPYFAFTIDSVLQRLHAGNNKSAWLYLAALHAATSSPFPDPFTKLTGAESGMFILQKAFVWSCSPYNPECVKTLEQIGLLSPKYSYYPEHLTNMIKTKWPVGLEINSYAAYDGYAIVCDKLLEDCSRLKGLFRQKIKLPEKKTDVRVCKRSYFRNINMYNGVAHLKSDFIEGVVNEEASALDCYKKSQVEFDQLVTLAELRQKRTRSCYTESVGSLLLTSDQLPHNLDDNLKTEFLNEWFNTCLRDNWLQLYYLSSDSSLEHELTMLFGAMVYSGKGSLNQVFNLHNITITHKRNETWEEEFPEPVMSLTNESFQPLNYTFISESIAKILKEAADSPPCHLDFTTHKEYVRAEDEYWRLLDRQVNNAVERIRTNWPGESFTVDGMQKVIRGEHLLNGKRDCYARVREHLVEWENNLKLRAFVDNVDMLLKRSLEKVNVSTLEFKTRDWKLEYAVVSDGKDKWVEEQWSFEDVSLTWIDTIVDDAKRVFSAGKLQNSQPITPDDEGYLLDLQEQRCQCVQLVDKIIRQLHDRVIGNCDIRKGLRNAGIHLALPPVVVIRDYLVKWKGVKDKPIAYMIGCLGVLWVNIKRFNRLIMYKQSSNYAFEFEREQKSEECENWSPTEYPEWLALELELDITIRPIQVQVATHMMNMDGNGVMQLNMGEGKTSVIVPMVVAALSRNRDMLCRVTVLNSIFATNQNLLAFAIGGFINKRVYTVPCGRDMKIWKYLKAIKRTYEECLTRGGVVITLPEYRLSFRLQVYNCFLERKYEDGCRMYEIENWLRAHARDIVDESDEVFSVKYRLIYTTGKQVQVDGGSLRWRVCQKVFEVLARVAVGLVDEFGEGVVEFKRDVGRTSPEGFRMFRILDDGCKGYFNGLVADRVLSGEVDLVGQILTVGQREVVREFLVNEGITEEDHDKFEIQVKDLPTVKKEILLLLSGYLRRGILFAALRKRWKVEYGVREAKPGGVVKLTAVPFVALNKASERTEFGHPDMAIVLTQLSYYYSGLSDNQLVQCFELLGSKVTGPDGVYNGWVRRVQGGVHETVRTYGGVNLQDLEQRTKWLFPVLRFHKDVIDFWLENVVFPHESKQFPGKIVMSASDLCYERCKYRTTGFSGTNDTSLLLPGQVSQQDLPVLIETNNEMEEILNGEENRCWRSLKMGVSCREVIEFMIHDGLRVLIDAGALMLELGNEEIAELWLKLDGRLRGVVYFNEWGDKVVKLRGQGYRKRGKDQLLSLSCEALDQFAVYLDDEHTRGTDIKLPSDFKACVTVGSGMRRDKLIQACWRMRKLGKGQAVWFYVSQEVCSKVSLRCRENEITTRDIVEWVKHNSGEFEKEGLVHLATNAVTYGKNLAADDLFEVSGKSEEDAYVLGKRCEDPDAQRLEEMYGAYHHQKLIVELIPVWFSSVVERLRLGESSVIPASVVETLVTIKTNVMCKIEKHIPKRKYFYVLEEEQEKELEPEQQEELEKYLPLREDPVEPVVHNNVLGIVLGGLVPTVMDGVSRLTRMFENTSVWGGMCEDGWGGEWYVTEDFLNVIKFKPGDMLDCFLRRPKYFVSFRGRETTAILVLSQFEVDKMISGLRNRSSPENATLHMFTGRWVDGQSAFVNSPRLQVPLDLTGVGVKLDDHVVAPLLIAAGNLYFESMDEQKAFARFLGLALRPWTSEQEQAHERGLISSTGFVSTDCPGLRVGCNFQSDPTHVVRMVLGVRNDVVRDDDHVVVVLDRCAYLSQG